MLDHITEIPNQSPVLLDAGLATEAPGEEDFVNTSPAEVQAGLAADGVRFVGEVVLQGEGSDGRETGAPVASFELSTEGDTNPELAPDDGGEGGGDDDGLPPLGGTPDDGGAEEGDDNWDESVAAEHIETPARVTREQAIQAVHTFIAGYPDYTLDIGAPPGEEAVAAIYTKVAEWAADGQVYDISAGNEFWVGSQICVDAAVAREVSPESGMESEVAELQLSIYDPEEPPQGAPSHVFRLEVEAREDGVQLIGSGRPDQASDMDERTTREFLDLAAAVVEVGRIERAERESTAAEIQPTGIGNIEYSEADLQQFIEANPTAMPQTERHRFDRTPDPRHLVYGVEIEDARDVMLARRPPDNVEVVDHLRIAEQEFAKVEAAGATIPAHTYLLITKGENNPSIATVSRTTDESRLSRIDPQVALQPGVEAQHLQAAGIALRYMEAARTEVDQRHLLDMGVLGQWGYHGQLVELDTGYGTGIDSLNSEFRKLQVWVEQLPPSSERDDMLRRIASEMEDTEDTYRRYFK